MSGPPSQGSKRRRRTLTLYLLLSLVGFSIVSSGVASAQVTPTNSGHLQLNQFSLSSSSPDPQLACGFNVSFYGYSVGTQRATVVVTPTAPSVGGTPTSVRAIWTTYTRTSTNQLDQNVVVSSAALTKAFASVAPSAQGFHAMVSIEVSNVHSSQLTFHTVWITSCASNTLATAPTSATPSSTSASTPSTSSSTPSVASSSLMFATTDRVGGTNARFGAGPARIVLDQQLQMLMTVVNTGTTTLEVQLANPSCDYLTLVPSSPQSVAPGTSLTFFCSHVLFTMPARHLFRDVATASVISSNGTPALSVSARVTALVASPPLT